jgi:hypothetical protein
VLYRAHVPILNVKYGGNACGPYRDWQNQEGMIEANGADVAPGFRLCNVSAETILDTGNDAGNYLGVAIYVQGQEVVLPPGGVKAPTGTVAMEAEPGSVPFPAGADALGEPPSASLPTSP